MNLTYDFSEEDFVEECSSRACRERTTLFEDIYESLCHFLSSPIDTAGVITDIKHQYKSEHYDKHRALTEYLDSGGFEIYYPKMDIYSDISSPLNIEEVVLPGFIRLESIKYGGGIKKRIKVKTHSLKTKNKVTVEILHLKVSGDTLKKILDGVKGSSVDLIPSKLGVWEWRQTFYNKLSGECYFCECFKKAIKEEKGAINNGLHPHVEKAIKNSSYKKGICHLCSGTNSDLFYCHPMYASSFKVKYGAYIRKYEIEKNLDEREAENLVREMKGVAKIGEKWVNETMLFNYIDVLFSNFTVQREASPSWLGNQRIDVFIPKLMLAIEYQGQQHYKPVELFGGAEGLKKTKERDKEKLEKCKSNGVDLIYFTYKDNLSEKLVARRLKKYIDL